jgi:pimeloyl-ACP methyl ester carboxylesterase
MRVGAWRVATFILVHGSWQGAWAWGPVAPYLELAGHAVRALDLPGECWDAHPRRAVTLAWLADHVAAAVDEAAGPVILVGHSGGGVLVSEACERRPDGIACAVYLCAFLLRDGESINDFYAAHQKKWMIGANRRIAVSPDGKWSNIEPANAEHVFYHASPPVVAQAAAARLARQPTVQSATRLKLSEKRFGKVPRVYIETMQDRSVHVELQRIMHTLQPCRDVLTLDTDHAPQLSTPGLLAAELLGVAARLA